jgi:glycosyltransferase involved in cell wall biosynthesis
VPAYNEEDCIRSHLKKIVDYLSGRFAQFEIIVVDDGSGDDTVSLQLIENKPNG